MERNKGTQRQNAKIRRRAVIDWLSFRLVAVILIIACIISFVSTQASLNEKRQQKSDLEAAIQQARDENAELEKFVGTDDLDGYMEKAAIEDLNYAYPNERRFYDTSRN
jgi:cell division protein FtsB